MRLSVIAVLLVSATSMATSPVAYAGQQVLEFKYVTKRIDSKVFEAPKIEGQTMVLGKVFGVACFKDGTTAVKDFIFSAELLKGSGPIRGFSTYTFEDGSSITASFTGEAKEGHRHGVYTILSGSGKYAHATGTGSFENLTSGFEGADLMKGKLVVTTP